MKRVLLALTFALLGATSAKAQSAVELHVAETIDLLSAVRGSDDSRAYLLDDLRVTADVDLEKLVGWKGTTAHVQVMNNLGASPNNGIGTLQGVDNIEVASHRFRLYEAWVEHRIGARTSVRAGLYDLNSEFYVNGSAGLLIGPAFGVGSELSATGVNGPSIFPSTSLTVRVEQRVGKVGYVRAALLNATAGCPGEPRGVDFRFSNGVLGIGEVGLEGSRGKLAVGYWRYSKRQEDFTETDADGNPLHQRAHGAYVVAELRLAGGDDRRTLTLFGRAGASEGRTTPYQGGWQAGLLIERLLPGRPASSLSFGMNQGVTTRGYRAVLAAQGLPPARAESALEVTYSDQVARWLTIQPDLQLIFDRGGVDKTPTTVVAALRTRIAF
ncbi:carbohydrate porin [Sphingomonas elodea]|uniref:carbohydrate porin n=1 Tax=Sphingomonas elodea TaxID=179878 RepID=UPI0002DEF804|nr:carbohydrate porin [Sphingomonas elodea]